MTVLSKPNFAPESRAEPSAAPQPEPPIAATRYLAAAAYTDKAFRDKALAIEDEPFRARAPELGINAALILQHCQIARSRKAWRDALLCIVFVLLVATGVFADLLKALDAPDVIENCAYVLQDYEVPLLILWLIATAIAFLELYGTQYTILTEEFAATKFSSAGKVAQEQRGNVVVYSTFSPFVGSGTDLGGWSFTINLENQKPEFKGYAPENFELTEIYNELCQGFNRLAIEGLSIADRLFVDGKAIRDDLRFLTSPLSRPVSNVDQALIETYRAHPGKTARHYLCLEISDWGGEVVLSTFIRLQKTESKLFVEVSNFLVPPLKPEYYKLDKYTPRESGGKVIGWILQAAVASPFLVMMSPFTCWGNLAHQLGKSSRRKQAENAIKEDPLFNYGAVSSIRELGSASTWRVYFQKLDKEMHSKVVIQQLLDVLTGFLDKHGIDTSEIKDRGSHILNQGVMVTGGTINAESLAVGHGAQANVAKSGSNHSKAAAG